MFVALGKGDREREGGRGGGGIRGGNCEERDAGGTVGKEIR